MTLNKPIFVKKQLSKDNKKTETYSINSLLQMHSTSVANVITKLVVGDQISGVLSLNNLWSWSNRMAFEQALQTGKQVAKAGGPWPVNAREEVKESVQGIHKWTPLGFHYLVLKSQEQIEFHLLKL